MKRLVALAAFVLVASGCQRADHPPADEYRSLVDQWVVRLGLPNVGIWPCRNTSFDQCYRLEPSQRWHGTWILGPDKQEQRFCPDDMGVCAPEGGDLYTLNWRTSSPSTSGAESNRQQFYTVDFVGRRSKYAHDLPHAHRFVIVVDRLVSMQTAVPKMADADFEAFRASNPGMTERCLSENRYLDMAGWRPDDADCFEMLPAQRWSGLWITGSEWNNFCPDPAKTCPIYGGRGVNWLVFAEGSYPKTQSTLEGSYRIEFIGRRTKSAGSFGHLNQYDHLMVVDKQLSIRKLPNPAKARTN